MVSFPVIYGIMIPSDVSPTLGPVFYVGVLIWLVGFVPSVSPPASTTIALILFPATSSFLSVRFVLIPGGIISGKADAEAAFEPPEEEDVSDLNPIGNLPCAFL